MYVSDVLVTPTIFNNFKSEIKNKNKNKIIEMLELHISNKYC